MEKKIFSFIGAIVIAIAVAFNVSVNLGGSSLSDIALANVEALAQNEGGNEGIYAAWACIMYLWSDFDWEDGWSYCDFYDTDCGGSGPLYCVKGIHATNCLYLGDR